MASLPLQEGPYITLTAAAALGQGDRVKLDSSGYAAAAGLAEPAIGYVMADTASGAMARIASATVPAMTYAVAHSSMSIGALVYSQAAARVDDVKGTNAIAVGYTLDAASAQDDVIRIVRCDGQVT
jgi:hypothetical protein